jgi:tetratricopeptide (TPR) repeat protein
MLPKNPLKKALAHFNKGDYRRSCNEFEAYLAKLSGKQSDQDQEMVRMYMAESYIGYAKELKATGKYVEAAEQLEKATDIQPTYADVQYSLACLYETLGKVDASINRLQLALEINPSFFRARVLLARHHTRRAQNEEALEQLSELLHSAPAFCIERVNELIRLIRTDSEPDRQESIFHNLLEEKPSSSQVSKQISLEAIQNGDYDSAITELRKSVSMHPDYPDLHNLLGIAYANKGMTDDAVMEFKTALKIHPDYLKAHLNIALTLYEKGARDEAMNHLDKVLKLDPDNELARNLYNELQPVGSER